MAKMKSDGITILADNLKKFGDGIADVEQDMLDAGAKACVKDWKDGITASGHVDTGAMKKSVKSSKKHNKKEREIYPRGKDKNGVRNAEKAFVLHYGTSNKPGDRFVDRIEENEAVHSYIAMQNVFEKYLKSKGLI